MAPTGNALTYATYLGGTQSDSGSDVAIDGAGNLYAVGSARSTNFPVVNAVQAVNAGGFDAFALQLNAGGTALVYSTFLGGGGNDDGFGLAIDSSGAVYLTGVARSSGFPVTLGVVQPIIAGGGGDAFVTKLGPTNQPPTVDAGGPYVVDEGNVVLVNATGSDPNGDLLTYRWDLDNNSSFESAGQSVTFSAVNLDGPGNHTIAVQATDSGGLNAVDQATVNVQNVVPTVGGITAPAEPVAVNSLVNLSASFSDPGVLDSHTAVVDWGDGSTTPGTVNETGGAGTVAASHTYATPGVYTVLLTVSDDDGGATSTVFQFVVVYDPQGGFVTGGGKIHSPPGAFVPDPALSGPANFGFVAKYKQGANVPTGQTQFQFQVASLNFHSTSYQWLVVAGHKAMFKGTGTINGAGNYGFLISAIDAALTPSTPVDLFRIKIWDKNNGDAPIYDNQFTASDDADPTTAISNGNIVIHKN